MNHAQICLRYLEIGEELNKYIEEKQKENI